MYRPSDPAILLPGIYPTETVSHHHPYLYLKSKNREEKFCEGFIESPCHCVSQSVCLPFVKGSVLPSRQELPPSSSRCTGPSRKPRSGGSFWKRKSWPRLKPEQWSWGRCIHSVLWEWDVGIWGRWEEKEKNQAAWRPVWALIMIIQTIQQPVKLEDLSFLSLLVYPISSSRLEPFGFLS